jgi:glycosyltransferase involved in cell wall biosynthesis
MFVRTSVSNSAVRRAPRGSLTVVIPVKDDGECLTRCLMALARQTVVADEIIVIDNGSEDDSAAIARAFGARVILEPSPGIPAASATGYDHASGDIIARLDADCIPAEDWIEHIHESFQHSLEVAAITGGARFIDGPRIIRDIAAWLYLGAYFVSVGAALGHSPLFGSNLAIRRTAWHAVRRQVHRHDPLVHDDMDLSFHLGREQMIRFDPSLGMGISIRALRLGGARLRWQRAVHSIALHWPDESPWRRWALRRAIRRADRAGRPYARPLALDSTH